MTEAYELRHSDVGEKAGWTKGPLRAIAHSGKVLITDCYHVYRRDMTPVWPIEELLARSPEEEHDRFRKGYPYGKVEGYIIRNGDGGIGPEVGAHILMTSTHVKQSRHAA